MARESIALSPQEIHAFIGAAFWVAVGSLDMDGSIFADVAPSRFIDGSLFIRLPENGRTAQNIARDPRIVCAYDVFPTYYEIKGASVHGRAVRREPASVPPNVSAWLDDAEDAAGLPRGHRVYTLTLEDSFGFDFAKIENKY